MREFLPPWGVGAFITLGVISILAGLAEASLLVLVVSAAVQVTGSSADSAISLPLIGETNPDVATALTSGALLGAAVMAIHVLVARTTARLVSGTIRRARDEVIHSYSKACWPRQSTEREGALQEAASTLAYQSSGLVAATAQLLGSGLTVAALVAMAMFVSWQSAIVVLAFGIVISFLLGPLARRTRRRAAASVDKQAGVAESIAEWSAFTLEYRTFGVLDDQAQELSKRNAEAAEFMRRSRVVRLLGGFVYRDVAILALVGAIAALDVVGASNIGAAGAVVLLVVRSISAAQQANSAAQAIREQSPNLDRLHERVASLKAERESAGTVEIERLEKLELRAVSYSYDGRALALSDIDLTITAGEAIGVIGPSGAGKSTLVELLLRLRRPTAGTVLINDVDYTQLSEQSLRRLVSFVPQSPRMFRGTVTDNISMHRHGLETAGIEDAARQAHVHGEVAALPDGFATVMGPRGAGLSGGQTQRIAIARALAGDPQLLILDEPTSALDARSESAFTETISELKGRTAMVVVAHRLSTLEFCDRVVAIVDGRIARIGTLDETVEHLSLAEQIADDPSSP